jgi:hypothetical protein
VEQVSPVVELFSNPQENIISARKRYRVFHPGKYIAAREHLSLRLSVAFSAIDHPPLGHLLLLLLLNLCEYVCLVI